MDAFEFIDEEVKKPKKPKRKLNISFGALIWNLGTLYFLVSAICVSGVFVSVFMNPYSGLNPWPPPTPTAFGGPTAPPPTPTDFAGPPPTPTFLPTSTEFTAATATSEFNPTPTNSGLNTPTPTVLSDSDFPYQLQEGSPTYLSSAIYHADLGCSFLGVGGQAFQLNASPVLGFAVQLTGTVNGVPIDDLAFTGAATLIGLGGYELTIAAAPFDSVEQLQVQLLDQQGLPLSPLIVFDTFDDCDKNMILINFVEVP